MKAEVSSLEARHVKARGLQKLKWWCQACEKQCRDEHGFKLHCSSPSHRAKSEASRKLVPEFSEKFHAEFVAQLRMMPRTPLDANQVYGEVIKDPRHVHMNATRWRSLSGFIRYLQGCGDVKIITAQPLVVKFVDQAEQARLEGEEQERQRKREEQERAAKEVLENQLQADSVTDLVERPNSEPPQPPRVSEQKPIKFSLKRKR